MVRVQLYFGSCCGKVMEAEPRYHQFGPVSTEHTSVTLQKGIKNIVVYVLYGVLLLLLFILLLTTGVKFSQISKDVNDIKTQLAMSGKTAPSPDHPEAQSQKEERRQPVYLKEISPVQGQCREGWISDEKRCYFVSTDSVSWSDAETQCKSLQAHLLVINNVEELDYISQVVALRQFYWIGLVERHEEGDWSWVDGSNFNSTQTFWDKGQPDNWAERENGEDCVQLHPTSSRKRRLWNDADCSLAYCYVCESPL